MLTFRYGYNHPSPGKLFYKCESFLGADFTHAPMNVSESRSPDCLNMIRDEVGQIRKRMGWHILKTLNGKILAVNQYDYQGTKKMVYITTTNVYINDTAVERASDGIVSMAMRDNKVYVFNGTEAFVIDLSDDSVSALSSNAFIPTVIISRNPTGGGTTYEEYNLITGKYKNLFRGNGSAKAYQLTNAPIVAPEEGEPPTVSVRIRNSDGEWIDKTMGTDFSVNYETGTVTFTSAPPSPGVLVGDDNVEITAEKTENQADRINKCRYAILYGIGGNPDRVFVSGNPDYRNRDFYSAQNDFAYFGDLSYSVLGTEESSIVGYSTVSGYLATHKDSSDNGRNIYLRSGRIGTSGKAEFPIANTLVGDGSMAGTHSFLSTESLFLTRHGIFAIASSDITGEKYSQQRSYFLNGKLLREDLSKAFSVTYNNMYWLFVNGKVYVLDGYQRIYERNTPYSSYQYEGYLLDNIPAVCAWVEDEVLHFGTADGKVCAFYTDKSAPESYSDDGEAIKAYWATPYITGTLPYNRKCFRYFSFTMSPISECNVVASVSEDGIWRDFLKARLGKPFSFNDIDFSDFIFGTDRTPTNIHDRMWSGYYDKFQFKLTNDKVNEAFALYNIIAEGLETNKLRGK